MNATTEEIIEALKNEFVIWGVDPGRRTLVAMIGLISRVHFDCIVRMCKQDGSGNVRLNDNEVLDPNELNVSITVVHEGRRTVLAFRRWFGTDKGPPEKRGKLQKITLEEIGPWTYKEAEETADGTLVEKHSPGLAELYKKERPYFDKHDDRDLTNRKFHNPFCHAETGSTAGSLRGYWKEKKDDNSEAAMTGKAREAKHMSRQQAADALEKHLETYYSGARETYERLGLLPGSSRFELLRAVRKDGFRHMAKIDRDVKVREGWRKEENGLEVCLLQ